MTLMSIGLLIRVYMANVGLPTAAWLPMIQRFMSVLIFWENNWVIEKNLDWKQVATSLRYILPCLRCEAHPAYSPKAPVQSGPNSDL